MISREDFQIIYDQGADSLYALFESLTSTTVSLAAKVNELEGRLNKKSNNSSKPPSSDGLSKKPNPQSLRKKSGKKPGGQLGHLGKTLELSPNPDITIVDSPTHCQHCAASLEGATLVEIEKHQVIDVPQPKLLTTEYQVETRCCSICQGKTRGEFPDHAKSRVQYGATIKAWATYLSQGHLLPYFRTCEVLSDLLGSNISEGTLYNSLQKAKSVLEVIETAIKDDICINEVVHFDETGLRVGNKLKWLHSSSTKLLTYYSCQEKRGSVALDKIGILSEFPGVAIHDGWKPYLKYACKHGLCNAHHLRELKSIEEQPNQPWAKKMAEHLREIKQSVDEAKCLKHSCLTPEAIAPLLLRYQAILKEGYDLNPEPKRTKKRGRPPQGKARNLILRLDRQSEAVLLFMYDFRVPFDNNLAERDVRMVKTKQKVSGCFRSDEGVEAFCTIRAYISTMRKQGFDILTALKSVFGPQPIMPKLTPE